MQSGAARKLTKDFRVFSVDFECLPPESGQHIALHTRCEVAGIADAVVFWWRCAMLRGDSWDHQPEALHNAPCMPGDPDHWRQAVCMLPAPSGGRHFQCGETMHIHAAHNDELVWFRLERSDERAQSVPQPHSAV